MNVRIVVMLVLLSAMLSLSTRSAVAECMDFAMGAGDGPDIGYAFTARVAEVSRNVDPPAHGNAPSDWHVELAVDRTYQGTVPDRIVDNGWDVGCHMLWGSNLVPGQRILVASDRFLRRELPTDPFWGDVLAWRSTDDGWEFLANALRSGTDTAYYPASARRARTVGKILAVVMANDLPPTDTAI